LLEVEALFRLVVDARRGLALVGKVVGIGRPGSTLVILAHILALRSRELVALMVAKAGGVDARLLQQTAILLVFVCVGEVKLAALGPHFLDELLADLRGQGPALFQSVFAYPV